jgi:hypothetical protein
MSGTDLAADDRCQRFNEQDLLRNGEPSRSPFFAVRENVTLDVHLAHRGRGLRSRTISAGGRPPHRASLTPITADSATPIISDKRSGKSSGDNLKRSDVASDLLCRHRIDRDAEGDLKPGETREVLGPIVAERRARALAFEHAALRRFAAPANRRRESFRTRYPHAVRRGRSRFSRRMTERRHTDGVR